MTIFVSALLIIAVAAVVALPLAGATGPEAGEAPDRGSERLEREKNAALLAIREAEFDRAMGKLSDDDYAHLRNFYEQRALAALNELRAGEKRSPDGSRDV